MKKSSGATRAASVGDAAVRAKTGKGWQEWFALLDAAGAPKLPHPEIVAILVAQGCPNWWSQMVTVGYEQERGLRQKHQTAAGYQVSGSKTIAVPLASLFGAWQDEALRRRWLPEPGLVFRKATAGKSLRITWADGSSLDVNFYAKGPQRSEVRVGHTKLASAQEAARMKGYWAKALERLKAMLED